jgi:hypothetical protein
MKATMEMLMRQRRMCKLNRTGNAITQSYGEGKVYVMLVFEKHKGACWYEVVALACLGT